MTRLVRAWDALEPEQRLAGVASLALLLTMFLPWYELQSLDRRSGAIHSHSISAFGDVSFVEAAVFLVALAVLAMLFARGEHRRFHLPGSDGTIVLIAGCWATLLIFYRVFSRPDGHGYPVGIQWGFFLAFIAAGGLAFAGWRMRAAATPEPPLLRRTRRSSAPEQRGPYPEQHPPIDGDATVVVPSSPSPRRARPVAARPGGSAPVPADARVPADAPVPARASAGTPAPAHPPKRPRYPPAPSDQLSFDDAQGDAPTHE